MLYLLRRNILLREIRVHLKHKNKIRYEKILPLIHIDDIAPGTVAQPILTKYEDGNLTDFELECISRITKTMNPSAVFEIGTFNGRTTYHIASSAKEAQIFTLDLPEAELYRTRLRIKTGEKVFIRKKRSGIQFIGTGFEERISQIYSDSAAFDFKDYADKMDLVFIDGSHSYEYVLNDTRIALALLRNGKGVIMWHDYGWNEVVQALNEFYTQDQRFAAMKNIRGTTFAYIKFD
jgi:predicted O-methyltransferase YrrM